MVCACLECIKLTIRFPCCICRRVPLLPAQDRKSKATLAITHVLVTMILAIRNWTTFDRSVARPPAAPLASTLKNSMNSTAPCCKSIRMGMRKILVLQWRGWICRENRDMTMEGLPICLPCRRVNWSRYANFTPRAWHQGERCFLSLSPWLGSDVDKTMLPTKRV